MRVLAIDPGVNGCLVFKDGNDITFYDTPTYPGVDNKGGNIKIYDEFLMMQIVHSFKNKAEFAIVELQRAYGWGDNAKALAGLAYSYGVWCAALTLARIPFVRVEPAEWKHAMLGSKNAPKAVVTDLAQELFPKQIPLLPKAKDGRSDALIMAVYLEERVDKKLSFHWLNNAHGIPAPLVLPAPKVPKVKKTKKSKPAI